MRSSSKRRSLGETLRFLLDQCVPDGVGRKLKDSGHDVQFLREALETNAADQMVATQAAQDERIFVSVDRDFKKMAHRLSGDRVYVKSLDVILFTCGQVASVSRVDAALPYIEFAWTRRSSRSSKPMKIEVQGAAVRILD